MNVSSINTDYNNDTHDWNEIDRQLKCIAEAKFTHVQWIHDWYGEYMYSKSEMLQARDVLNYYGLKAHSIHAAEGGYREQMVNGEKALFVRERCTFTRKDYTNPNNYLRLAGVDLLKNRIDLCSYIGAKAMVLHMQLPFGMFQRSKDLMEEYYQQVYKSFDELQSYAKAAGVKIALENLLFIPVAYQLDQFERMFSRYDDDFVGLCFDSGHASIMCQDNYYLYLEKYASRLIATHLQDTDSIARDKLDDDIAVVRSDSHRTPFTGVLDWNRIAKGIAKSKLELPADFEVGLRYGQSFANHDEEIAALIDCREKSEKLNQMILDYRTQ